MSSTVNRHEGVLRYFVGGFCIVAILLFSICYSVREGRYGVVLRFGEAVRVTERAGLHFKAPWPIEQVLDIDGRSRSISTPQTELLTRDKKNIVLMIGGGWRPSDPVQFYRAIGSALEADEKISSLLVNAAIAAFGRYDLSALVSTDSETLQVERVEGDILNSANEVARSKYGIEVVHAGFQRVSLPERNVDYVLEQMRAERRKFAAEFRADGQLEAARIRTAADLESAKILAEAEEQSAQILGSAEAQAAEIYATAHRSDPAFYSFVRSLEGLRKTLGPSALVTLRTDSEPFKLLVDQGTGPSSLPARRLSEASAAEATMARRSDSADVAKPEGTQ
ncbi:MAG: protease modulator HflC [Pseudomonadota bacterium]